MKFTVIVSVAAVFAVVGGAVLWTARGSAKDQSKEPEIVSVEWTPPKTTLDPDYVKTAKALLGNGLADPRKGRFCHVQVTIGDAAWNHDAVKEAYGWVEPDGKHAVLFDGVEYSIGANPTPADLAATVKTGEGGARIRRPFAIRIDKSSPALPALLVLVGRDDLLGDLYQHGTRQYAATESSQLITHLAQRYNMLAAQALMSRKDDEGLTWSRELLLVDKVKDQLNLQPLRNMTVDNDESTAYARQLFDDFRRRVDHPKTEPIDVAALRKQNQSNQISTLIDDLDTVAGKQMGQPGGAEYFDEPVFNALVKEGPTAVLALLDVLQNDNRFTRTVSYGRDFFPARSIHTVKNVAWRILVDIWPSATRWQSDPSKIGDIDALRKAWSTESALTENERWVQVLRDDAAGERLWLAAGQYLVKPADEIHDGNSFTPSKNPNGPMTGADLRPRRLHEVSQLIAKRSIEMASVHTNSTGDVFVCNDALQLAHCLAKWEPSGSLTCLREVCAKSLETAARLGNSIDPGQQFGGSFSTVIADRALAKDPTAAKDYGAMCGKVNFAQGFVDYNIFRPLWEAPGDAAIQSVGDQALGKWGSFISSNDAKAAAGAIWQLTGTLPSTPLLTVGAYRRLLASALKTNLVVGTMQFDSKYLRYKLSGGGGGTWNVPPGEIPATPSDKPIDVFVGDQVAQSLSIGGLKGLPPFHILASVPERTKERSALAAWLTDDKRDWVAVAKTSPFSRMFH